MNALISIAICLSFFSIEHPKKEKLKLVWSDEFNINGAPDSTNWVNDIGNGQDGWGNHEIQSYTRSAENIVVKDGMLIIQALKQNGQWTSARLKSQGKRNWTYGKIVFRAKLPAGKGTWPALWMLSENIVNADWPACGEIDIMEHVGKNPTVVQCAMHTISSHGDTVNKNSKIISTFDTEFHTYEALWTKDKIEFFIDGASYYTYNPAVKNNATWPFNSPFFIIMNVAIGGGFGGPVDESVTKAKMEVDYVRVYAADNKKKKSRK